MRDSHLNESIRRRAEEREGVSAVEFTTSAGTNRPWYCHDECDDEVMLHGENAGFMQCKLNDDGSFVLECQTCGYRVDY